MSLATAATLELSDGVAPTVLFAQQIVGTANNSSGGASAIVQYQVSFSELMDGFLADNARLTTGGGVRDEPPRNVPPGGWTRSPFELT